MNLIIQDSRNRIEFFAKTLGCFGVPLMQALTPNLGTVMFEGKPVCFRSSKVDDDFDPFEYGFSSPRVWAEGCLGWIWCQWLSHGPAEEIRKEVEFVVARGMELQERCSDPYYRGLHDLWLLNCAILGCSEDMLKKLAERVVDSNGGAKPPSNNGELHVSAWCGMLKHWILGELKKAAQQADLVWGAYRYDNVRFAPKPLIIKWLAGDWKSFVKLQQKDFTALWDWARKHRIVTSENEHERVIAFDRLPVPGRGWCWAHCGLAMLAHRRQGIEVATDAFWFPPYALECVAENQARG